MEKKKQLYQWPSQSDVLRISQQNILCTISEPCATGKSELMIKLNDADKENICDIFNSYEI